MILKSVGFSTVVGARMRQLFAIMIIAGSSLTVPAFGFHRPAAFQIKSKPKVNRYVPGHGRSNPLPPLTVV